MFPTDSEFTTLYIAYLLMLLFLIFGLLKSENKTGLATKSRTVF